MKTLMMTLLALWVGSLSLTSYVRTAAAASELKDPLVEPRTRVRFHTHAHVGDTDVTCLGAGVRRIFLFNVYAVTFCLETDRVQTDLTSFMTAIPYQKGPTNRALVHYPRLFRKIIHMPAAKLVILRMVRDVSADKLAKAFQRSLKNVLPEPKIQKLMAAIPGDARQGDTVRIFSSHPRSLTIAIQDRIQTIEDPEIATQLWRVWIGPESVTPSLKESIATRLETQFLPKT